MDLETTIAEAQAAATKTTMIEQVRANPTTPLGEFVKNMSEDLADIFMSLTPADLGVKAPTKRKTKRPPPRSPVSQPHVHSELLRWTNNGNPGDACTMKELQQLTGGSAAQIKKAIADLETVEYVGKGRGAKFVIQPEAA